MIGYLLNSTVCLAFLLAFYHLILENEKIHQFNRFFLLLSLISGISIPLLNIELVVHFLQSNSVYEASKTLSSPLEFSGQLFADPVSHVSTDPSYLQSIIVIYILGVLVMLSGFTMNLIKISLKIISNEKIIMQHNTIVLMREKITPHSFLKFTFLNKEDYLNKNIDQHILDHELTHVRQKHSLDVLAIEIVKIIFWFNPILYFYKKAIQLNHEFLADESVINLSSDVSAYQNLLLRSAGPTVKLANNLNFYITKKRLIIMTKHTSRLKMILKEVLLLPLLFVAVLLFADSSTANQQPGETNLLSGQSKTNIKDSYLKGGIIEFNNSKGLVVTKKYEDMTAEEKNKLPLPLVPTQNLLKTWTDGNKYSIVIDARRVSNASLEKRKHTDFVSYLSAKDNLSNTIIVDLLTPEFFTTFKKYGGTFVYTGNRQTLRFPPPVVK